MTNTMGGAHLYTSSQSIFQQMMGPQNPQQPQQTESWVQTLQIPCPTISIPSSSQQPELITFPSRPNYKPGSHHKRKLETSEFEDACHQAKQFITEEKMAAHFKDLRISSNHESENPKPSTSTGLTSSFPRKQSDMDLDFDAANAMTGEQTDETHPRLVISDELKRMQQEPILPSAILSKLERPSMALVLWEPPNKHLRVLPSRDTPTPIPSISIDNNSNNNNNNDVIPDLNNISPSAASVFEPMEL